MNDQKNWNGEKVNLYLKGTTVRVQEGDRVATSDGDIAIVRGFTAPRHSSSTGRVYVEMTPGEDGEGWKQEYFPSVFGLVIR